MSASVVLPDQPPLALLPAPPAAVKPRSRQWLEKLRLLTSLGLTPNEYDLYGFQDGDRDYRGLVDYLSEADLFTRVRPTVNNHGWAPLLDNKLFFQLHYAAAGLPLPRFHGVYDPAWGFAAAGGPLRTADELGALLVANRETPLVLKPLGGSGGRGVAILDEIEVRGGQVASVVEAGERVAFAALVERLGRAQKPLSRRGGPAVDLSGYLIQDKIVQHPFFEAISPYAISTFRVVTFLDRDGEVHVHFTTVRLGRRGNATDNWELGGLSVDVDRETGEMGRAVLKAANGREWTEVHPDSGVRFAGQRVPRWDALLEACRVAARLTPGLRYVGWDIALSPSGPVFIEGNSDWVLPPMQMMLPGGFLRPEIRAQYARFGVELPARRLPPPDPRRLRAMLADRRLRPALIPIGLRRAGQALRARVGRGGAAG